jgi:hypothetical protein
MFNEQFIQLVARGPDVVQTSSVVTHFVYAYYMIQEMICEISDFQRCVVEIVRFLVCCAGGGGRGLLHAGIVGLNPA